MTPAEAVMLAESFEGSIAGAIVSATKRIQREAFVPVEVFLDSASFVEAFLAVRREAFVRDAMRGLLARASGDLPPASSIGRLAAEYADAAIAVLEAPAPADPRTELRRALAALEQIPCACSTSERAMGHLGGCWLPLAGELARMALAKIGAA